LFYNPLAHVLIMKYMLIKIFIHNLVFLK